jgi:hypothetical protein
MEDAIVAQVTWSPLCGTESVDVAGPWAFCRGVQWTQFFTNPTCAWLQSLLFTTPVVLSGHVTGEDPCLIWPRSLTGPVLSLAGGQTQVCVYVRAHTPRTCICNWSGRDGKEGRKKGFNLWSVRVRI